MLRIVCAGAFLLVCSFGHLASLDAEVVKISKYRVSPIKLPGTKFPDNYIGVAGNILFQDSPATPTDAVRSVQRLAADAFVEVYTTDEVYTKGEVYPRADIDNKIQTLKADVYTKAEMDLRSQNQATHRQELSANIAASKQAAISYTDEQLQKLIGSLMGKDNDGPLEKAIESVVNRKVAAAVAEHDAKIKMLMKEIETLKNASNKE